MASRIARDFPGEDAGFGRFSAQSAVFTGPARQLLGVPPGPQRGQRHRKGVWIMLVLTRRINENILIGDETIVIKILEIRGGRVRLGIEAPQDVSIRREEVSADHAELELTGSATR
jgi:carbon storage regulator